ncbi:MAG TPA: DsbA family protein [Thermoleophilaceae bacterium]|nr:DsbA family protein [Thermoleophilaceae bacterium]
MRVDFFFGAMSPYSWFAAERIDAVLPEASWRPVFAGGLFRAAGRASWGLDERRAAGIADCEARAAAHGLGPIRWPEPWPTNDVLVARAMIIAAEAAVLRPFALAAMRLAFLEGADLGEPAAVAEAARRVALDPEEVAQGAPRPEVKERLRTETDAAHALGVIGVPSVVVGDEVFWGDDRLEQAAATARSAAAG